MSQSDKESNLNILTPEQEDALLNREIPEVKWWNVMSKVDDPAHVYSQNMKLMEGMKEKLHQLREPVIDGYSKSVFFHASESLAIACERFSDLLDCDIPAQPTSFEVQKIAHWLFVDNDLVEAYFVYQREVLARALKLGVVTVTWPLDAGEYGERLLESIDQVVDAAPSLVELPKLSADDVAGLLTGIASWPVEGWLTTLEKGTGLSKGVLLRWACWKVEVEQPA